MRRRGRWKFTYEDRDEEEREEDGEGEKKILLLKSIYTHLNRPKESFYFSLFCFVFLVYLFNHIFNFLHLNICLKNIQESCVKISTFSTSLL